MPSSNRGDAVPADRRRALALWTVLAAQLMLAMDFLIVVVALPRIQTDLGCKVERTANLLPNIDPATYAAQP